MNPQHLRTFYNSKLTMNDNNNRFTTKQSAEELKLKAQLNPNFDIEMM